MRSLTLQDAFRFSAILDKMEIQADINAVMDASEGAENAQAYLGGQLVLLFIKSLHKAEKEVIEFISDITGDDVDTVRNYGIKKTKEVFTELFKNEELATFFT